MSFDFLTINDFISLLYSCMFYVYLPNIFNLFGDSDPSLRPKLYVIEIISSSVVAFTISFLF